jgi:hypothetical protein
MARSCSQLSKTTPSSAAQALLQLTPCKFRQNTPPVLDFLLPSLSVSARRHGVKQTTSRRQFTAHPFAQPKEQLQTTIVFNPQKDKDGKEMNIMILPGAVEV